ncbi:hypothetical protein QX201_010743 [Fusarium graminearum]
MNPIVAHNGRGFLLCPVLHHSSKLFVLLLGFGIRVNCTLDMLESFDEEGCKLCVKFVRMLEEFDGKVNVRLFDNVPTTESEEGHVVAPKVLVEFEVAQNDLGDDGKDVSQIGCPLVVVAKLMAKNVAKDNPGIAVKGLSEVGLDHFVDENLSKFVTDPVRQVDLGGELRGPFADSKSFNIVVITIGNF